MNEFERCLKQRRITRIEASLEMIRKELSASRYDLERAKSSLSDGDYKWSSVQSYYSIFHSAKALVLKKGYRERGHHCLLVAVRELYVKDGSIDAQQAEEFELCMGIRLDADYGIVYDRESAEIAIGYAESFFKKTVSLLGNNATSMLTNDSSVKLN